MFARTGEVGELFEDLNTGVDVERDFNGIFGTAY